jgi:hypothetical protein
MRDSEEPKTIAKSKISLQNRKQTGNIVVNGLKLMVNNLSVRQLYSVKAMSKTLLIVDCSTVHIFSTINGKKT